MTLIHICKKIKEYRNEIGMTQKELALALFMDERNYAKIERGQKKTLDVLLLKSIADILKVDLVNFILVPENNTNKDNSFTEKQILISDELKECIFQLKEDVAVLMREQKKLKEVITSLHIQLDPVKEEISKD